jgi:prepilin-type N-terminal cleavage/methylation domain-containing protein
MALKSRRGYTLAEMMITVAVMAILASMAAPLLIQVTNFWRLTSARNTIQRDVRASLDTINRFTRQAKSGTVVIDQVTGQPPYSRVTFTSVQNQTVSFYQTNNVLYMKLGNSVSTLSKNIAYISFTFPRTDDVSLISVAITTQSPTYLGASKALQLSIQKVRIMN